MRRFLAVAVAIIASCSALTVASAGAATSPALSCSNPQTLSYPQQQYGTIHFPGNLTVQADVWSARKGETQTMQVCDPSSWSATVNVGGQPEDGVTTYPDSGTTYPDNCGQTHKLSETKSLTSTFAAVAPTTKASWDYAYDLFLGGGICSTASLRNARAVRHDGRRLSAAEKFTEVMVWDQWSNVSVPNAQKHATIDGVAYDIYFSNDRGYIQVRRVNQTMSGSENLGHILAWLAYHGLVKNVHLIFTEDGFEVLTTYGQPATFNLTDFSVTQTLK